MEYVGRVQRTGAYLAEALTRWNPRPNSGNIWLDIGILPALGFLQFTFVPYFFHGQITFDFITPWLMVNAALMSNGRATLLAFLAALVVECHGTYPAGLYLGTYWILTNLVIIVRSALSLYYLSAWLGLFALSQLAIIIAEAATMWVLDARLVGVDFFVMAAGKTVSAVLFGVLVYKIFGLNKLVEVIPE